ncbi:MAG: tRNA lysidine(34) synthetase TilS [Bacteroidia bacterium]|nr:tRNA lysidine(34) synthetase TilS [Bacteroidia bacterium]
MQERFLKHITEDLPFLLNSKLLIALSGGMDSVVLTHLCRGVQLDIALAHCNFNLRDQESDGDETFTISLSEMLDLEIFIQHFDTEQYADDHNLSIQMAARELRYNWLNELGDQLGYEFILTAHHADDNLETFFINLSRGSGLDGLTGIPQINDRIVRPLIPFSREEIEAYAKSHDLNWREDSSNKSMKYLRNSIRQELIPSLKTVFPDILSQLAKTQGHLNDAAAILDQERQRLFTEAVEKKEDEFYIDLKVLNRLEPASAYLFLLLKPYGFTQWDDIYSLVDGQSGKQVYSSNWRLLKDRERLILSPISQGRQAPQFIPEETHQITTSVGIIDFEEVDRFEECDSNTIYVDKDLLNFPLVLRSWEDGDSFFPIGMNGKKKISKFFKDEKLSLIDKERSRLLCSNRDIVWVVGHRADDRFKITQATRNILKIEIH